MKYIFFSFLLIFTCLFEAQAQVDPKDLSRAVKERLLRVPEFSFIKEEADKLGVKAYLFGGTASAFGHYVRWDLERERGDKKYQKERFDYDFTNIYRGNQDLDIVVDGTAKQALDLKEILEEKYPHFVGDKESWEVRLLRDQIERKSALLNDPDFLNQHTDTNSTGMIAINDQGDDDFVFRDLFSWDEEESAFLKDVSSARITFLYSKTHNETTRYKEGKNPPIFAAVRYLAKLAQYELKGIKEDLDLIKKIIKETDWSSVQNNSYVKYKLEEFGKKVLLNAPNSEYAWNLLEDTGLRKKLIEMDGNRIRDEGTLSWWMNKEPLRSKPIGLGHGRRAEEIFLNQMDKNADNKNADKNGEIILSHETSDFKAYENITRSSRGEANAFISREGIEGESAISGDGFYTKLGFKGAAGTNLTIRFKLNLKAREGSDFIYNHDDVVILKNKKAITLMQENINVTLKDFIKLILNGGIEEQDLGLIEKMKRKFKRKVFENNEIDEVVLYLMKPNILKSISKKSWILYLLPTMEKSKHFDLLLKELVKNKELHNKLLEYFFSQEESVQYEEQLDFIINNLESKKLFIRYLFSRKHWKSKRSLIDVDEIIQEGKTDEIFAIIKYVLPNEVNRNWFWQISELRDGDYNSSLIEHVLSQPIWKNNGDLITKILSNDHERSSLYSREDLINRIVGLLMLPHWREHPEWHSWVEILFSKDSLYWKNQQLQAHFIEMYLHSPHWNRQINIINRLLDNPSNIREMASYVLNLPHMVDHPYLIKKAILKSKHEDHWESLSKVFKNKGWEKFPEILVMLIQKRIDANNIKNNSAKILKLNYFIDYYSKNTIDYPKNTIDYPKNTIDYPKNTIDYPKNTVDYPKNTVDITFESNISEVLKLDHWKNHPDLIAFTGKENFTIQDIYLKSKEQDFLDFQNNRNNKKISSKEDGVLYSDNEKLYSSNEEETLYSGEKPYSASGGERTCTALLN